MNCAAAVCDDCSNLVYFLIDELHLLANLADPVCEFEGQHLLLEVPLHKPHQIGFNSLLALLEALRRLFHKHFVALPNVLGLVLPRCL